MITIISQSQSNSSFYSRRHRAQYICIAGNKLGLMWSIYNQMGFILDQTHWSGNTVRVSFKYLKLANVWNNAKFLIVFSNILIVFSNIFDRIFKKILIVFSNIFWSYFVGCWFCWEQKINCNQMKGNYQMTGEGKEKEEDDT